MSTRAHLPGHPPDLGSSPVFWAALVVLIVNDHCLKGSGWLSGDITGKLSDFAWLIVAPVALARLLGARSPEAKAMVLGPLLGLFVVTELSQTAADAVCAFASHFGIHGRLWADPTDLIALSVVPLTWHVMAHAGAQRLRPVLGRVALGLGVFASVATTQPPNPQPSRWTTAAYLVNRSGAPVDARVRWSDAEIDCEMLASVDLSIAVSGVIFDDAITYRLLDQETVPLEQPDPMRPGGEPPLPGTCQLALVAVDGAPDTIVMVPADAVMVLATQLEGPLDVPGRAVEIALDAPGYALVVGEELSWGLRDDRARAATCGELRPALEVSSSMVLRTPSTIVERGVGSDGCTQIVTEDGGRTFLCVPEALVPFGVGETLTYLGSDAERARFEGETGTLHVVRTAGASSSTGPFVVRAGALEDCAGERTACGAFVRPFLVEGASFDAAGLAESGGSRLALGRTEQVVIAPGDCEASRTVLGPVLHYAAFVAR